MTAADELRQPAGEGAGTATLERSAPVREGPPGGDRLTVSTLLHPYEESRLALALATSVVVFGIAGLIAVRLGNGLAVLGTVVTVATAAAVIWLGIQINRARLLGRAVRVSAGQLPALEGVLEEVRRRLDYWKPVDVYVIDKAGPSAQAVNYLGARIVLLEGDLVADLQQEDKRSQLVFLIGRFLGAMKAKHRPLIFVQLAIQAVDSLIFLKLFLLPYFRAVAYSGDQIGQACCGDLHATVAMMNRLMVGKELGPSLAVDQVLDQAVAVKRRILPRLAQIFMDEPHLTSRYLNVLCFAERVQADALSTFRAGLGTGIDTRLGEIMARSPHRRPITPGRRTSRNLVATGLTAGVLLIATLMLFHPDQTSPGDVTGTQAAQLVNSLPPPSPTPRPWNPQDAILSADGMQAAGYKVSRDRAVSKLSWHGWNRQFENNSALTPYYYVDVYVYRLPGGATPAKAIQDAGCDFTFTNGTISTTHVGAPANNRGAPADACLYVIPKAVDYVEYITADQYALVEVAIEARNANQDSAALSEAAGLAAQQLDTIDNLTR